MPDKTRIILDHERMQRAKTAMLAMVTKQDRCRINGTWYSVNQRWQHGQPVEEVNHYGKHTTALGDVIIAQRIDEITIAHVQVNAIEMADTNQLTEADINALGYADRAEFNADWGEVFSGRCWLFRITHLSPQSHRNGVRQ